MNVISDLMWKKEMKCVWELEWAVKKVKKNAFLHYAVYKL